MVDIKGLLKYNEAVRHSYFESFKKLSWDEFIKNREASFASIRNIFIHTLDAIDYWLDFLQKRKLRSHREFNDYRTYDEVQTYMDNVEKRTSDYLDSLSRTELKKTHKVTGDDHKTIKITTEDILIHVFEEEVHHRGEINALLWQMGIDPPPMGWKGL